jgi:MYXO-CTERM domain-containing protein
MNITAPSSRCSLAVVLALTLSAAVANLAHASSVVVPGFDATTEGSGNNGYPFASSFSSQRYQQVYGASAFSGGPILITQIAFRPDATFGSAFSTTLPSVQIDLSTTSAAVDGLSTTFANNVGANDTVVFSGALSLSSADTGPAGGPKAFDIVINLTTPFLYNPALGNLLLDIRDFSGGFTTAFDAEPSGTDAMSRVYTESQGVNSPTANAGEQDTVGLVTQFTVTVVPEPSSVVFGLALVGAAGATRRRRSAS